MNHQAEKLAHPVTDAEIAAQPSAVDGVLVLVFACPACGWIDSRREPGWPATPE
jgi:hypothetical protein